MTPHKKAQLERQRLEAVERVIRYQGFGLPGSRRCYGCDTTLTAKGADGRWACPWCWVVRQLELVA